jgi:hypothetical protein
MTLALQATGITKRFPSVLANDHVNFSLNLSKIGSRGNLLLFVFGRIVACQVSSRSPPTAAVVPKASATKR